MQILRDIIQQQNYAISILEASTSILADELDQSHADASDGIADLRREMRKACARVSRLERARGSTKIHHSLALSSFESTVSSLESTVSSLQADLVLSASRLAFYTLCGVKYINNKRKNLSGSTTKQEEILTRNLKF